MEWLDIANASNSRDLKSCHDFNKGHSLSYANHIPFNFEDILVSTKYVDAREPLEAWFHFTKVADWVTPVDIKADFRSASILMDGRVIFNIAGNKHRLVVWINYTFRTVYIRCVGTHEQYDNINQQTI